MTRPTEVYRSAIVIAPGAALWVGTPVPFTAEDLVYAAGQVRPVTGSFLGLTQGDASLVLRYTIEQNRNAGELAARAGNIRRTALDAEISATIVSVGGEYGSDLRTKLIQLSSDLISAASTEHDTMPLTMIIDEEDGRATIVVFFAVYAEQYQLSIPSLEAAKVPVTLKAILPESGDNLGQFLTFAYEL